jgi:hypothetical protein
MGGGSGGEPSVGGQGGSGGQGGGEGGGGGGPDPDLYPPEDESNNTLATANALPDGALGFTAELPATTDVDVFSVFVPLGSVLRARIEDGFGGCPADANVTLQIYDPNNLEFATETGLCPSLDNLNNPEMNGITQEGTYFVRVTTTMVVSQYVVVIEVTPPTCGDLVTSIGEECDDGNMAPPGCEAATRRPGVPDGDVQTGEVGDNNSIVGDAATPAASSRRLLPRASERPGDRHPITCEGGYGRITPDGDLDYIVQSR